MGYKCNILAVSPGLPRDDLWTRPEGGLDAATAATERLLPGWGPAGVTSSGDIGFFPQDDNLYVGTWGTTVVIGMNTLGIADHPDTVRANARPDETVWTLAIQSTVDYCLFQAMGPHHDRLLAAWTGATEEEAAQANRGTPLPFEEPYWAGQHAYPGVDPESVIHPFDPLELGAAALLWIFGIQAETPPEDDIVTPLSSRALVEHDIPLHVFRPTPSEPEPEPEPERRRGWASRLFGR